MQAGALAAAGDTGDIGESLLQSQHAKHTAVQTTDEDDAHPCMTVFDSCCRRGLRWNNNRR